jgi:hypothetical protein
MTKLDDGDPVQVATCLANEIMGALAFICDHGKIELGTPQSKRLLGALAGAKVLGIKPEVPKGYPMFPGTPIHEIEGVVIDWQTGDERK